MPDAEFFPLALLNIYRPITPENKKIQFNSIEFNSIAQSPNSLQRRLFVEKAYTYALVVYRPNYNTS